MGGTILLNDNLQAMAYDLYMHRFFGKKPNGKLSDILIEHPKSKIQVGDAKDSEGDYPFFTSGDAVLKWPEHLVDGRCVLLNTGGNADVKFYVGKMAYSTDAWCISAKDGLSDYLYMLLFSIKQELNQKFFLGTGLKHLQKPLLKDRPIYIPDTGERDSFNEVAIRALAIISANQRENRELQELRDWLLPMLMNGQATVRPQQANYRLHNKVQPVFAVALLPQFTMGVKRGKMELDRILECNAATKITEFIRKRSLSFRMVPNRL